MFIKLKKKKKKKKKTDITFEKNFHSFLQSLLPELS